MPTPSRATSSNLLPPLTPARRLFRQLFRWFCVAVLKAIVRLEVTGQEHIPSGGPLLLVSNHLSDFDPPLLLVMLPWNPDLLAKAPLRNFPVAGQIMRAYGCIWIEQFKPDRAALRAALAGLKAGRVVGLAPEGRESLSGGLEQGTQGAAFLALRADATVLPMVLEGSEHIYANLKRLRRTLVRVRVGASFRLAQTGQRKADLQNGTEQIMRALAELLSPAYRGVYRGDTG